MWSASQKYGSSQCSACTAASAARRTDKGSEPMIGCSRVGLFHTGITWTPFCKACTQACNCAWAWCANRSPTPMEYLASFRCLLSTVQPHCCAYSYLKYFKAGSMTMEDFIHKAVGLQSHGVDIPGRASPGRLAH